MSDITLSSSPPAENLGSSNEPKVGEWYYVADKDSRWLGCVIGLGSNYVKLEAVNGHTERVKTGEFHELCTLEPDAENIIADKVTKHQEQVALLMGDVKRITASLGVDRASIAEKSEGESTALAVVHGTADINAHKKALIRAKTETLPDLFKRIKHHNKMAAAWMQAPLIPMKAEACALKGSISAIERRIFTVELYAGLTEDLVLIQEGTPAPNDEKIHLRQSRCYMDEECLANYDTGGMDYQSIDEFDTWLIRPHNLNRILPEPRCVVAFRIRRHRKDRDAVNISDFIRIRAEEDADKMTFLYIRNGEQVYRMRTAIDFGEQLFPDKERSTLLGGGNVYVKMFGSTMNEVISEAQYQELLAEAAERNKDFEERLAKWKATPEEERFGFEPTPWTPFYSYEPCTPDHLFYDDAMREVARAAMEHNRVAVVLQGLLDRSPAFHPHPPWQLWKPEGFVGGIELVYDDAKTLTDGDKPDFEAYRTKLNASLKKGSYTVGQQEAWERHEAKKENERLRNDWRARDPYYYERYKPYGDPGPGLIAEVVRMTRKGECHWQWERDRKVTRWVPDPDRPGYDKIDDSKLTARFSCSSSNLLNVSAYKPGDYKIFFNDRRTRTEYLKWAPMLLAAEDWHAKETRQ